MEKKQLDIESNKKEIKNLKTSFRSTIDIEEEMDYIKNRYDYKINFLIHAKNKIKLKKSSLTSIIFRIIFSIPTLFLSWIGFVSEKKLEKNKLEFNQKKEEIEKLNSEKESLLIKTKETLLIQNHNINKSNKEIEQKINSLNNKIEEIKNKDYTVHLIDDGFINLRKKLLTITKFTCKGVYIIWNKTKNKYYVGQSKDVYKRLFTNHFNNGDVKNIIFAKDWFNNDDFYYKIIELETKDELDNVEKEYIEKYDSFRNGYNNTGGNY